MFLRWLGSARLSLLWWQQIVAGVRVTWWGRGVNLPPYLLLSAGTSARILARSPPCGLGSLTAWWWVPRETILRGRESPVCDNHNGNKKTPICVNLAPQVYTYRFSTYSWIWGWCSSFVKSTIPTEIGILWSFHIKFPQQLYISQLSP